jgi:26S proteasome regulatory subunit N2
VLEPLLTDSTDFVRQGANIAKSMILIQQNEKTFPEVKEFREKLATTVSNKHEESLARFGATLAQGILDASGRNATLQLENPQTNTLNMKAIVGLTIFTQYWYWHPLAHFLCLSFTPTSIVGVTESLKIPQMKINCHTKEDVFGYPPKTEVQVEKQAEKVATAVLSTTHRARNRAAKKGVKVEKDDIMEVDASDAKKETTNDATTGVENQELQDSNSTSLYVKDPYQIENMTRVLPTQMKYVTFQKNSRFTPIRKFKSIGGVVVLKDNEPGQPFDKIKTLREKNTTEAPLPLPFTIDESIDDLSSLNE